MSATGSAAPAGASAGARILSMSYTTLLRLALPLVVARLFWRGRREPGYRSDIPERFGFHRRRPDRPVIWLHAVSLGETRAAAPLVQRLLATWPDHQLVLTHTTATGRAAGLELFGAQVIQSWLPYDLPGTVGRFLERFRPRIAIIMETELWPNMVAACARAGIPMLVANARLSAKSAAGYRRLAPLTARMLACIDTIAAQTDEDAARFEALGARHVTVCGNLKFDLAVPDAMLALGHALRQRFGADRPVWLAASTREGEEEHVLDAHLSLASRHALLVLVPRHPQRFDAVAALLEQRGVAWCRRSHGTAVPAATRVVLGDSMGEMLAYFAACDVAFVGGSLVPTGGQNLIEACAVGTPVLVGPHTWNFAQATERAIAAGAARQVADGAALARAVDELLADTGARRAMGDAARRFAGDHRGAADRLAAMVAALLTPA